MTSDITTSVTHLYERFPYPRYPLLARPRWQEGYLTSSLFAARLRKQLAHDAPDLEVTGSAPTSHRPVTHNILLGGAGEVLPYIVRRWEPWSNRVLSLDLSRRSLFRARLRLGWITPRTDFVQADLCTWLEQRQFSNSPAFDHIDAFGVLHHMPDPGRVLKLFAANLAAGGTIRLMVYNSPARCWIHQLQGILRILKISPFVAKDLQFAQLLIQNLGNILPNLGERLKQIGSGTLNNEARFVDTFLHPREARLSIAYWGSLIDAAGLEAFALFDRYAELDDLKNPLWHMPNWQDLTARANDNRFENNLELFLARKKDPYVLPNTDYPRRLLLKPPPLSWFSFQETAPIDSATRWSIWHAFLRNTTVDHLLGRLTRPALQRLARIGAILPQQITSPSNQALARASMASNMNPPEWPQADTTDKQTALLSVNSALKERGLDNNPRAKTAAQTRVMRLASL